MKIGLFDSGVGGLTVLKELRNINTAHDYIYYGDTLRAPYGSRSEAELLDFTDKIVKFLISKDVDMIVIACLTINSIALDYLRKKYDLPVHGLITSTCDYINNSNYNSVGVIATEVTIKNKAWEYALNKPTIVKATPGLVPLIEAGLNNSSEINTTIDHYLNDFREQIDALILGCTHYPYLKSAINQYFNQKVTLINPGTYLAKDLVSPNQTSKGTTELYFSSIGTVVKQFVNLCMEQDDFKIKLFDFEQNS